MYEFDYSSQFKKDLKKVTKQGLDISLLQDVLEQLKTNGKVEEKYKPHPLKSNWIGYMDCHIAPDWVLIYKVAEEIKLVRLARTGSHSEVLSKKKK